MKNLSSLPSSKSDGLKSNLSRIVRQAVADILENFPDKSLGSELLNADLDLSKIPEIQVAFHPRTDLSNRPKVTDSKSAADLFRKNWDNELLHLQEAFKVMYLNRYNRVLGLYHHSNGGMAGTVCDPRIVLGVALKSASPRMLLCHNHPSGSPKPSEPDRKLTKKMSEAAKLMDMDVLDHIILTPHSHYSFADEGEL